MLRALPNLATFLFFQDARCMFRPFLSATGSVGESSGVAAPASRVMVLYNSLTISFAGIGLLK